MPVETYLVLMLKLISGIQAIHPPRAPVPPQRAALYARAAAFHGLRKEIDPFELVALARNESDFNDRAVGPDGLDCGLTQTRITYSRYTCSQLQRSSWLAFSEAARELQAYAKSCSGHGDYDRCRLNKYNSGQRYARRGVSGRYYLRVSCFAEAARRRLPVGQRCRNVRSREEIALLMQEAGPRETWPQLTAQPALAKSELGPSSGGLLQRGAALPLPDPLLIGRPAAGIDAPEYGNLEAALAGGPGRLGARVWQRRRRRKDKGRGEGERGGFRKKRPEGPATT